MNRAMFLQELRDLLFRISPSERDEYLYDYEEHIRIAMETGKTEEEAVASLGSPKAIAKEIIAEYYIARAERDKKTGSTLRAVFSTISLGFFNLIFVSGPFFGAIGILIALFASSVALILSPIIGFLGIALGFVSTDAPLWANLFVCLMVLGLGLMALALTLWCTRLFAKLMLGYTRFNLRMVRGGARS